LGLPFQRCSKQKRHDMSAFLCMLSLCMC
jgi:hypothetical protein